MSEPGGILKGGNQVKLELLLNIVYHQMLKSDAIGGAEVDSE